ncbi:hypothetical protein ACJX0J_008869, partial [Zea mays]
MQELSTLHFTFMCGFGNWDNKHINDALNIAPHITIESSVHRTCPIYTNHQVIVILVLVIFTISNNVCIDNIKATKVIAFVVSCSDIILSRIHGKRFLKESFLLAAVERPVVFLPVVFNLFSTAI